MSNISVKVNLRQLKHTVKEMKKKDGSKLECLIIPIEPNHLYKGEKGVYLDLQAFELKEKKEGSKDTHLVKQSLPKEVYNGLSDEQKNAIPIIGNAILWNGTSEPEPQTDNSIDDADDDLPF